jgi:hypothetical protein
MGNMELWYVYLFLFLIFIFFQATFHSPHLPKNTFSKVTNSYKRSTVLYNEYKYKIRDIFRNIWWWLGGGRGQTGPPRTKSPFPFKYFFGDRPGDARQGFLSKSRVSVHIKGFIYHKKERPLLPQAKNSAAHYYS